jgi:hypothetical protein
MPSEVEVTLERDEPVRVQLPDGTVLVVFVYVNDETEEHAVVVDHRSYGQESTSREVCRITQAWAPPDEDAGTIEYECEDEGYGESGTVKASCVEEAAALYVAENGYMEPEFGELSRIYEILVRNPLDSTAVYEHVQLDPFEPECTADEGHDWERKYVKGTGAGVHTEEECAHCGVERTTKTNQPCRDCGEGLYTLVKYNRGAE